MSNIEKGIEPVCEVLNSIPGVKTLWSCEGHPERPSPPYVTFVADASFAFGVHNLLERAIAAQELAFSWKLTASFNNLGGLHYTINSNDNRVITHRPSWLYWFSADQWSKSEMDRELLRLSILIAKAKPHCAVGSGIDVKSPCGEFKL